MKRIIVTIMSLAVLFNIGAVASAAIPGKTSCFCEKNGKTCFVRRNLKKKTTSQRKKSTRENKKTTNKRKKSTFINKKSYERKSVPKNEMQPQDEMLPQNEMVSQDEEIHTPVGEKMSPKEVLNRWTNQRINIIMDDGDEYCEILENNPYLTREDDRELSNNFCLIRDDDEELSK